MKRRRATTSASRTAHLPTYQVGDAVEVIRPHAIWAGEVGAVKSVIKQGEHVTEYLIRSSRNFDLSAKPDELKPYEERQEPASVVPSQP